MQNDVLDALVEKLRGSDLFAADFPRRQRLSHAEFATLTEEEYEQSYSPGAPEMVAIRRVKNVGELEDAVRRLGGAKYAPAVPLLAALWADCALVPVRNAAGHALRAIGTPDARRALFDLIDDSDHLSVFLGVAAAFDEDPARVYDRLHHFFEPTRLTQPGGAAIPHSILAAFVPSSFRYIGGKSVPAWSLAQAPSWFRTDRRWLDLCVSLRRDPQIGRTARAALRYADADAVGPALEAAKRRESPRPVHLSTAATGDLLARYHRGEHVAVWAELRSHEALAGPLLVEAEAVARETMARVARNADRLAERLAAEGWRPLYDELRVRPRAGDAEVVTRIEEFAGSPLPLSLRAFWEVVGGINFVWDYDSGAAPSLGVDLPMDQMDPVCVDSPQTVTHLFDGWEEQLVGVDPELADPLDLSLAPDFLHKANISGGGPYGVVLPFLGADPVFDNEAHRLPFVDYLRLCFRWAGFPLLERHASRPDVRRFLESMGEGLEPF